MLIFYGGAKGIRTPDLYNANVARYQLCYSPKYYRRFLCSFTKQLFADYFRSGIKYDWFVLASCAIAPNITGDFWAVSPNNCLRIISAWG